MNQRQNSNVIPWRSLPLLLSLLVLLPACSDDETVAPPTGPAGRSIYGVDGGNNLVVFGALRPGTLIRKVTISGLQGGENIVGIDFRAVDGKLYAMGSSSRIYTVDTTTGSATAIGVAAFTPGLNGASFGFDFNPVPDRIRAHSDAEQNLRLHPETGVVAATDTALAYAAADVNAAANPSITGTAYTNNVIGATSTVLFAIDFERDILVKLASPNNGQLTTVGNLGVNTTTAVGFDIAGNDGMAYLSLTPSGSGVSTFYTLNTTTGAATSVGAIGHTSPLVGITIRP